MSDSNAGAPCPCAALSTICLPIIAIASMLAQPAFAQATVPLQFGEEEETTEAPLALGTVVIEALRMSQPTAAVPNAITIIETDRLDNQLSISGDLSTVLGNTVPNYSPSRQKLTSSGETLRGRVPLFLIDGVPQNNPLRDSRRSGHTIDPDLLERVEIVNGSNSIQGMGALGGIINLQTRDMANSDEWESMVRLRFATPDDFDSDGFVYKGVLLTGRKFGKADVTLGMTLTKTGLFFDGENRPVGLDGVQGDVADTSGRDYFLKLGYDFTPDQRLQLMVNDFRQRGNGDYIAVDGDRATGLPTSAVRGEPEGDTPENDVTTVTLDYRHEALLGGQLRAQAFYQDFEALFGGSIRDKFQDPAIAPIGTLFDQTQTESRKLGLKLTYSHHDLPVPGLGFTAGIDLLRDNTRQILAQTGREYVPEMELQNWAPFIQVEQKLFDGRLSLSGGLRYENATLKVDDFTTIAGVGGVDVEGGAPSFDELLPNAGAVVELGGGLSAYGSYSKGFTMPDVGRVLRSVSTPGQDVGSLLKLEPVIADNREIGLEFEHNGLTLHTAYFWSDSDLGMRLSETGGIFHINREKTEIEGFEISAAYDVSTALRIGGLYSHTKAKYDSDGDDKVDTDLGGINVAPDRLNIFAEWNGTTDILGGGQLPVNARVQASHFFDRNVHGPGAPSPTNQNFDGYTLVDLNMGIMTGVGDFRFGVENLLDEQFITYYSQTATPLNERYFAGRGRTFSVTYEKQF